MNLTTEKKTVGAKKGGGGKAVVVEVNTKSVELAKHRITGLQVKEAAIAQGVEVEVDFHLTLEAHGGQPAERIDDDELITVTKHSVFTCNDGDENS